MSESHAKIETGTEKKDKVTKPSGTEEKPQNEEEIDIDLNDPEVEAAAAKIQSAFKNRKGFGKK